MSSYASFYILFASFNSFFVPFNSFFVPISMEQISVVTHSSHSGQEA